MRYRKFAAFTLATLLGVAARSYATEENGVPGYPDPWWVAGEAPATLFEAFNLEQAFLTEAAPEQTSTGPLRYADTETCVAMAKVELPCDYITRLVLAKFLASNGKSLFPPGNKHTPYCTEYSFALKEVGDCMSEVELPEQNRILREAILRNTDLFVHGNLRGETVRENWE